MSKPRNRKLIETRPGLWLKRIKFWRAHNHLWENHRLKRKQAQNPEWGTW